MAKNRSAAAERALQRAIDEATTDLRRQVKEKDAEISRLHGVLSRITSIAAGVAQPALADAIPTPQDQPQLPREKKIMPAEVLMATAAFGPPVPQDDEHDEGGPELAGGDNMGAGRWV